MSSGFSEPRGAGSVRAAAEAVVAMGDVRFDHGDARPLGAKGRRTRQSILRAAGEVLVEQGWHAATIGAVAARAGIGAGTMYQYFRSKQEVLAALVGERTLVALEQIRGWDPAEGRDGLRRIITRFVSGYARSAGFQRVWEEVSLVDPEMAELRTELTEVYVRLFADAFVQGEAAGLLDAGPDPTETARALCSMVDRYCHQVFVRHASDLDEARVVALLTDLWAGAIRLR